MCSDTWKRRVGLYGTHNNKPFPIISTELKVAIDEGAATEVSVDVRHTLLVEHHTAVLWFPVSELRGISCFAVEINGERIVGCLRRAVSQDATTPHPSRAPRDAESLYYFHAEGGDVLTDLPRGEKVVLRLTFTTSLIPVDGQSRKQPCFMLPIASCFPRGVDDAQVTVKMKDLIREIYCGMREMRVESKCTNRIKHPTISAQLTHEMQSTRSFATNLQQSRSERTPPSLRKPSCSSLASKPGPRLSEAGTCPRWRSSLL